MLADAEVEIFPVRLIGLKIFRTLIGKNSLVRRSKIRRTSEEPWNILGQDIQRFARRVSSRKSLRVSWKHGKVLVPRGGKLSSLHQLNFIGELRVLCLIGSEKFGPFSP